LFLIHGKKKRKLLLCWGIQEADKIDVKPFAYIKRTGIFTHTGDWELKLHAVLYYYFICQN
jgi:hypothetical protein